MNTNAIQLTVLGVVLFGAGMFAGSYFMQTPQTSMWWGMGGGPAAQNDGHYHGGSSGMINPHGGMGPGMMADMLVESEREFVEGMIPHHQEAVDTSRELLERGGTTEDIRALARGIIQTQREEIEDMKAWHELWYGEPYEDTGEYEPMMRELENLSGAALDQAYLTDMIVHHMGAIMMARSVQPYIEHQEVAELTEGIVSSQSREISLMGQYLRTLQQ